MIDFEYYDQTLYCRFSEIMDSANSPLAEKEIEEKIIELKKIYAEDFRIFVDNEHEKFESLKIIFNLEKVSFVSSFFMRVCIIFAKKLKAGNFSIVNTSLMIKKIFKIAGLDKFFDVL